MRFRNGDFCVGGVDDASSLIEWKMINALEEEMIIWEIFSVREITAAKSDDEKQSFRTDHR